MNEQEINVCPGCGKHGTIYSTRNGSNNRHCCACSWEGELPKVSEQQERKTWAMYTTGRGNHDEEVSVVSGDDYICLVVDIDDHDIKYREAVAQQIAEDHNRIPDLEVELLKAEQARRNMGLALAIQTERLNAEQAAVAQLREQLAKLRKAATTLFVAVNGQVARNNQGVAPLVEKSQALGKVLRTLDPNANLVTTKEEGDQP